MLHNFSIYLTTKISNKTFQKSIKTIFCMELFMQLLKKGKKKYKEKRKWYSPKNSYYGCLEDKKKARESGSHFTCITIQKRPNFLFSSQRIQNNTAKYNLRLMKTFQVSFFAISFQRSWEGRPCFWLPSPSEHTVFRNIHIRSCKKAFGKERFNILSS